MVAEGQRVHCELMPSEEFLVVETNVERDVDVVGDGNVIRVNDGDTLLRKVGKRTMPDGEDVETIQDLWVVVDENTLRIAE